MFQGLAAVLKKEHHSAVLDPWEMNCKWIFLNYLN